MPRAGVGDATERPTANQLRGAIDAVVEALHQSSLVSKLMDFHLRTIAEAPRDDPLLKLTIGQLIERFPYVGNIKKLRVVARGRNADRSNSGKRTVFLDPIVGCPALLDTAFHAGLDLAVHLPAFHSTATEAIAHLRGYLGELARRATHYPAAFREANRILSRRADSVEGVLENLSDSALDPWVSLLTTAVTDRFQAGEWLQNWRSEVQFDTEALISHLEAERDRILPSAFSPEAVRQEFRTYPDDGSGSGGLPIGPIPINYVPIQSEMAILPKHDPVRKLWCAINILSRVCEFSDGRLLIASDTGRLRTLTKHSPTKSTDAHINVIAHTTREELRRLLTETDQANGFANRFLWPCTRRSKLLPDGGHLPRHSLASIVESIREAVEHARQPGRMMRTPDASRLWEEAYRALAADRDGLLGAVTNRAEAQVLRLSLIFALLDCSPVVDVPHLLAALECWRYCEESARYIFGAALGDPLAEELLSTIKSAADGVSRAQIRDAFQRHKSSSEIRRALGLLYRKGLAHHVEDRATGGRPAEIWHVGPRMACDLCAVSQ